MLWIAFGYWGAGRNGRSHLSQGHCFTIGRAGTQDIVIDAPTVSRRHAELVIGDDGALLLVDCESTHGTFLERGGRSIPVRQEFISPTDTIRLGEHTLPAHEVLESIRLRFPKVNIGSVDGGGSSEPESRWERIKGEDLVRCGHCGGVKKRDSLCGVCGQ